MHSTNSPHAAHDELLVARLFGNDVDEAERGRALDQIATCEACAALFADLGEAAAGLAGMPIPPRPRDFTLTPGDAARLRPRARIGAGWLNGSAGWVRPLGTLLSGVGALALAVVVATSALPSATTTPTSAQENRNVAPGAVSGGGDHAGNFGASAVPLKPEWDQGQTVDGGKSAPSAASAGSPVPPNAGSSAKLPVSGGATGAPGPVATGQGSSASSPAPAPVPAGPSTPAGGPSDLRIAAAAGAGLVLVLGLALLLAGTIARRRAPRL